MTLIIMLTSSEIKSIAKYSAKELAQEVTKGVATEFKKQNDVILRTPDVAELLKTSKDAVKMMCHRKQITYHKVGRSVYFLKSEIIDLIF